MSSVSGKRGHPVEPRRDYGFFGPDSVAWRVWRYPTSFVVGFVRAVVIEELDPFLVAAVDQSEKVYTQPDVRYDRTLAYFATVLFSDSATVLEASNRLVKVHSMAKGIEPISGRVYDANDPGQQLWIHLTAWHSILLAYERYGPGKLSPEDEQRYWADCAVAAELQTFDPKWVPASRDEVRAYFQSVRPRLACSESAQQMMHHLLGLVDQLFPTKYNRIPGVKWTANEIMRMAVLATIPRWMRALGDCRQSALADLAIVPVASLLHSLIARTPELQLQIVASLSPHTLPVLEPVWHDVPPVNPEVITPAQARERYNAVTPFELYESIREQADARNPRLTPST